MRKDSQFPVKSVSVPIDYTEAGPAVAQWQTKCSINHENNCVVSFIF